MIMTKIRFENNGVQSMVLQVGLTPGPIPRGGPTAATGGQLSPYCETVRVRRFSKSTDRHVTRKQLNVLQWNAEGVLHKKLPLAMRLHEEQVDIACIQENHLRPSHTFKIADFESVRLARPRRS